MISFKTKAEGGVHAGDRTEIRRALSILIAPGDHHELRALPGGGCRIVSGDDLEAATNAAMDLCDRQVYWSLNPIKANADRARKSTVTHRRWFLIDVDPVRPADTSSTEEEKARAYDVAGSVALHLLDIGWPAPLIVDSGNGWHLLYRIDLPNDTLSQQILKAALAALGRKFDTIGAKVDKATHDAPRVSKLPGTYAKKGVPSQERPHRMARIVMEPSSFDVVTLDQLKALDAPEPKDAPTQSPPRFATTASDGPGKEAYVKSAMEKECYRVLIAPVGERNHALNRAAFALGQFDGWPEMIAQHAREALRQAAHQAGLSDHETRQTIESGWKAGQKEPRPRPADENLATEKPAPKLPTKLTKPMSEFESLEVDWLWEGLIAKGFISLFAGQTGVGKSFVTLDYAARLSRGEPGAYSEKKYDPQRTLIISEDPPEYMIKPRLVEMKADTSMIHAMTWEGMSHFNLSRLDVLEAAYVECGRPSLVIIDPPTNFVGKTDEHKNSDLRGVLMGLVQWIDRHNVAMVMITHLNKSGGKGLGALSRVIGGTAWITTARINVFFELDPDTPGQSVVMCEKNSVGKNRPNYAYKIEETDVYAVVKWIGPVDVTADDAVNRVKKKSAGKCAVEWLEDRFREQRSWKSKDLVDLAEVHGHSYNSIAKSQEARALPIKKKEEFNADGQSLGWFWHAKYGWPPELKKSDTESPESPESLNVSRSSEKENPLSDKDSPERKSRNATGGLSDQEGGLSGAHSDSSESGFDQSQQGLTGGLSGVSGVSEGGSNPQFPRPDGWEDDWTYFDGTGKKGGAA